MVTRYVMQALENYDPALVAEWNASTQPNFCFQDKQYLGTSFDAGRRKIMYSGIVVVPPYDDQDQVLVPNTTGQTLWNGVSAIPPGNLIDQSDQCRFIFQLYEKDVDSGAVVHYDPYNPANLVPTGIGSGGITGISITTPGTTGVNGVQENFALAGGSGLDAWATLTVAGNAVTNIEMLAIGSGYQVGDVLACTGVSTTASFTVTSVNSGSDGATWGRYVYDATLVGLDLQTIVDPRTNNLWVHIESCEIYLFRHSANFSLEISPLQPTLNRDSESEPIGVTADWVYVWENYDGSNVLHIVPSTITSPEITADKLLSTHDYDYPDDSYYFRQCVGPDGNLYVYGAEMTGTRDYKLWSCVPGTGFSDITPWSGSTGPNADCAAWVDDAGGGGNAPIISSWSKHYIIQLPASGNLVCISKLLPRDAGSTDPTNFRMDATYFNIAGATFDYHQGFVTGYMTSAWAPTTIGSAEWLVLDYWEMNNYLEVSDYVHPSTDYTVRRFAFICQAMSGGEPVDSNKHIVFVDFRFVSGSAPAVVNVIPETGWDTAYPDYSPQTEVVAVSLPGLGASGTQANFGDVFFEDNGLWDVQTGAMWFSGANPVFCTFNSAFAGRESQVAESATDQTSSASSPFMKLTTMSSGAAIPTSQGHIF